MIQNRYKKGVASIVILALLALAGTGGVVVASDQAAPGDALFAVDQAAERARLALTTSSEARARIHTELAQERVEEVIRLAEQEREQNMVRALQMYQEHFQNAQRNAQEAQEQGNDVDDVLAILAENAARHQEVLAEVYERVPDQAKDAILRAMETSQKGFEEAAKAVSGEKQDELINGAGQRLQNAREKLEDQGVELPEIELPSNGQSDGAGSGQGNRPSSAGNPNN